MSSWYIWTTLGDFCQRERGFQQEGAEQDAAEPRNIARTSNDKFVYYYRRIAIHDHFSVQFSLLSSW